MLYTQLEKSYKFYVIAEAVYARELEHFHYDFDRRNFEYLASLLPEGDYKADIIKRLDDTVAQMANVESIRAALLAQVDDDEAYAAAVKRVAEKRREQT